MSYICPAEFEIWRPDDLLDNITWAQECFLAMFAYTVFTKGQQKLYKLYPSCSSLFPSTKLFKFFRHGILSTSKYDLQGLAKDL